jgi:hypothetical protein
MDLSAWQAMDHRLRVTFITVAAAAALLVVGAGLTAGLPCAASVMTGAVLALANLYVLARIVATIAVPPTEGAPNARLVWSVMAMGKFIVLFGGVWFLMTRHLVDPIELLVGTGCLPIGIAIGAVVSDKTSPRT